MVACAAVSCGTNDGGAGSTLGLSLLNFDENSTYYETSINNALEQAEPVDLSAGAMAIRGDVRDERDTDVYNLGPATTGDRILVTMATEDALDGAVALLDAAGITLLVNDHRNVYLGRKGPFIDVVVRRPTEACYLAAAATPGFNASGAYTLVASRESGFSPLSSKPETVLLTFSGGKNVSIGGRPVVDVPTFDAGAVAGTYRGETSTMEAEITARVREDFAGLDVTILSTSEGDVFDGVMTRVFFGTYDEELLGIAQGVDEFNATPAQEAIVFTDTFSAFMTLSPSVAEMAQAIANVASHEIGHLLGLVHTSDPFDIMDVTAGLNELLEDQSFGRAPLHHEVFPTGQQDAARMLADTVGSRLDSSFVEQKPRGRSESRRPTNAKVMPARTLAFLSGCQLCTSGHSASR